MWNNVPDDWCQYYKICSRCGSDYHAADGGCEVCYELTDEEVEQIIARRLDWEDAKYDL